MSPPIRLLLLLGLVSWAWPWGAWAATDGDVVATHVAHERLDVLEEYNLPMREVSGLAQVQDDEGALDIFAIGDASYDVGRFRVSGPPRALRIEVRDVAGIAAAGPRTVSQWEAVATDASGRICALAEDSARVTCLSSDLTRMLGVFDLNVTSIPRLERSWEKAPNSRGEGIVLLRRGHALVLKEKEPSLLVEFGPQGESAMGWSADAPLRRGETFEVPESHALVALKVWDFADSLAAIAKDGSELAVGPDERLYMLSQESAILIRLEGALRSDEDKVHASAAWRLPHGFGHAEGLVIDGQMHPWIAVDIHETDRPNLFRLTPIAPP